MVTKRNVVLRHATALTDLENIMLVKEARRTHIT